MPAVPAVLVLGWAYRGCGALGGSHRRLVQVLPDLLLLTVCPCMAVHSHLQLEPEAAAAAAAAAGSAGGGTGGGEGTVLGRLAAARAFLSPNFEQVRAAWMFTGLPIAELRRLSYACCTAGALQLLHPRPALHRLPPPSLPTSHHPRLSPQLFRGPQPAGQPTCLTKYLGIAAVGTSGGATFVLLPGAPVPAAGAGKQGAPAGYQMPRCVVVGAGWAEAMWQWGQWGWSSA